MLLRSDSLVALWWGKLWAWQWVGLSHCCLQLWREQGLLHPRGDREPGTAPVSGHTFSLMNGEPTPTTH